MTNEEKYKTPSERYAKYREFCIQAPRCYACPSKMGDMPGGGCYFVWLTLKAEEEKPIPCPCCGAEAHTAQSIEHLGYKVVCVGCGLQTGGREKTPEEAVALWNRRVK